MRSNQPIFLIYYYSITKRCCNLDGNPFTDEINMYTNQLISYLIYLGRPLSNLPVTMVQIFHQVFNRSGFTDDILVLLILICKPDEGPRGLITYFLIFVTQPFDQNRHGITLGDLILGQLIFVSQLTYRISRPSTYLWKK